MGKGWLLIYYLNAWEDLKYYNVYLVTLLTKTSSSYAIMQLLLLLLYLKKSFSSHRRHRRNRGGTVKIWLPIIFSFFFCNRLEIWPDDKWFWYYYYYYFYYYIIVILFQSWICSLIILIDLLYGTLCIHSSTKKWLAVGSKNRRILRILNFESCKAKQSGSRVCSVGENVMCWVTWWPTCHSLTADLNASATLLSLSSALSRWKTIVPVWLAVCSPLLWHLQFDWCSSFEVWFQPTGNIISTFLVLSRPSSAASTCIPAYWAT